MRLMLLRLNLILSKLPTLIIQDNKEIKSNEKDINKNFEELLLDKIKKN